MVEGEKQIRVKVPEGFEQVYFADIMIDDYVQILQGNIARTTNVHGEGVVVVVGRETERKRRYYFTIESAQHMGNRGEMMTVFEDDPNMYFVRQKVGSKK